jgi:hypothetical protein
MSTTRIFKGKIITFFSPCELADSIPPEDRLPPSMSDTTTYKTFSSNGKTSPHRGSCSDFNGGKMRTGL